MIRIRPIFDSAALEVFAFKCCVTGAWALNLEVQLTNEGSAPVSVPNRLELHGASGSPVVVDQLTPSAVMLIEPGETRAFYGYVDESVWAEARSLVVCDEKGNRYQVDLSSTS